jgi:Rhamnan synthesis protein F
VFIRLRYLICVIIGIIFDLGIHLRDWITMARGLPLEIFRVSVPVETGGNFSRTAIVAVYPNLEGLPFILNLLNSLRASDFRVLLISSKRLGVELAEPLLDRSDRLVERYNIGRDFGSYQMGVRLLKEWGIYDSIDTLCLANDSMFYPASFSETVTEMVAVPSDWVALFESYQLHYHAQSFLEIFGRPIIQSETFNHFWSDYVPLSSRTHAIHKGEIGLSKSLVKAGFFPSAIFTSSRLVDALSRRYEERQDVDPISKALFATLGEKYVDLLQSCAGDQPSALLDQHASTLFESKLTTEIAKRMESRNPTHAVGLLAHVLCNAPLKRDLVYRGTATIGEMLHLIHGFTSHEKACIERDLRIRGNPSAFANSLLKQALFATGRI